MNFVGIKNREILGYYGERVHRNSALFLVSTAIPEVDQPKGFFHFWDQDDQVLEKSFFAGCSKMPRCKAPLPSPKRLRAGRRNPESGVATNKERHLATPTSW